MIRGGTTGVNDMYFCPDATARVAAEVGLRATVGLIVFDFPSAWGTGPDDYLHKGMALHDQLKDEPLIRTIFAPRSEEHTSELQSLMRISYAVFCLKKKNTQESPI